MVKDTCHIGIDLLGGDTSSKELLQAVLTYANDLKPGVHLTLFGTEDLFHDIPHSPYLIFHPVSEIITMDESPLHAIRRKKDSSICLGIRMLKERHLDAFISTGNTGAIMACAKLSLPPLPGVERPALLALIPTKKNEVAVLDVGANTTYKAEHLLQFAAMGIAYQKSRGIANPRVGLLNIGSEEKKGTPELRKAYLAFQEQNAFHFSGNIEGRDVFHGDIDVLITDGFTGNVFLKTAEGIASVLLEDFEAKGILTDLSQRLNYSYYAGALLCGIDGIVIKCHGNASARSLVSSITSSTRLVEHSFLEKVKSLL